jgi:hypothetical protein
MVAIVAPPSVGHQHPRAAAAAVSGAATRSGLLPLGLAPIQDTDDFRPVAPHAPSAMTARQEVAVPTLTNNAGRHVISFTKKFRCKNCGLSATRNKIIGGK